MVSVPPNQPTLAGAELTAEIIKGWLIDGKKTRSGMLGVNDALQVVSVKTFQHGLTQPAIGAALGEAIGASATAVVVYGVVAEGIRPVFDNGFIGRLAQTCEALNVTLLDVMAFSSSVRKGWLSAREQNLLG